MSAGTLFTAGLLKAEEEEENKVPGGPRCRECNGSAAPLLWVCYCFEGIHKRCLHDTIQQAQTEFRRTHCGVCNFPFVYDVRQKLPERAFMPRDSSWDLFCLLQLIVVTLGCIIFLCDRTHRLPALLPSLSFLIDMGDKGVYYGCGGLVFLFLLICARCGLLLYRQLKKEEPSEGDAYLLILFVFFVVMALVLIFVGSFVLNFVILRWFQWVLQHYAWKRWLHQEMQSNPIHDFGFHCRPQFDLEDPNYAPTKDVY